MKRPKQVAWLEAIAVFEFGLVIVQAVFYPIEDGYFWADIAMAAFILALTLWFTRKHSSIVRKILIVLSALTVPFGAYTIYAQTQSQPGEVKWSLAFVILALVSLILLLSKSARQWSKPTAKQQVEAGQNGA